MAIDDNDDNMPAVLDEDAEVMDLLDAKNFQIHEITESEIANWLHSEFHSTHPDELVRETFPDAVMRVINSDHHKSRDGVLTISYDHYSGEWYVSHPGYVREAEAHAKSYLEAASNYLSQIHKENGAILYRELEDAANRRLAPEYSVEIGEHSMTLYKCENGQNRTKTIGAFEKENPSVEELITQLNEWITARY